MASKDFYIVSSSPPRTYAQPMSSSPLPTMDELLKRKSPGLRKETDAWPTPVYAEASFATAAALLARTSESVAGLETATTPGPITSKSATPKVPRKAASDEGDPVAIPPRANKQGKDATAKKPRQSKAKTTVGNGEEGAARTKAPPKSRTRKAPAAEKNGVVKAKAPPKPRAKKVVEKASEATDGTITVNTKVPPNSRARAAVESPVGAIDGTTVHIKRAVRPRAKKAVEENGEGMGQTTLRTKARPNLPVEKIVEDTCESTEATVGMAKAPAKPRAKKAPKSGQEGVVKRAANPKPRTKKPDAAAQTTIPKARITKKASGASLSGIKSASRAKADPVGQQLESGNGECALEEPMNYGLAEASRRRTAWTPPPTLPSGGHTEAELLSSGPLQSNGFGNLLGNFGFSTDEGIIPTALAATTAAPTRKRKLIELIQTNGLSKEKGPKGKVVKEKPPKKKARTLTELATSAYAEVGEESVLPGTVQQHLSLDKDGFIVPAKPLAQSPAKKGTAREPLLLSPESAMRHVGKQEFVFGTSSQLAREESPGFLRQIHDAMQASNALDASNEDFTSRSRAHNNNSAKGNLWSAATRDERGNLMDVDMVDLEGSMLGIKLLELSSEPDEAAVAAPNSTIAKGTGPQLCGELPATGASVGTPEVKHSLDVQTIDLISSPAVEGTLPELPSRELFEAHTNLPNSEANPPSSVYDDHSEDVWHDIELFVSQQSQIAVSQHNSSMQPIGSEAEMQAQKQSTQKIAPREPNPAKAASKPAKISSSATAAPKSPAMPKAPASAASKAKKPDYGSWTDAKLAKQIATYRFKPVKKRDQMVALLEKCWAGKQKALALQANPPAEALGKHKDSTPLSTQPGALEPPVLKARGRPKKDSTTAVSPKAKAKASRSKITDTVADLEMDSDTPLSQLRTPKKKSKNNHPLEEIYDSDHVFTPSPPRRSASQLALPPEPLPCFSSPRAEFLTPGGQQTLLFSNITSAIQALPKTKNPREPSWHEKILMYDPIILEDLTVWLNVEGLGTVGCDDEVEPKVVKKWCESRSVCCLWKENLAGGKRKRH